MPNHFHFMIFTDERCEKVKQQGNLVLDPVTNGFRKLLSTYAHEFNKQNNRSGALFRPKTKSICLNDEIVKPRCNNSLSNYYFNCFNYIHNNPVKDGLVKTAADWEWSSYNSYYGTVKQSFCNKTLALDYCSFCEKGN